MSSPIVRTEAGVMLRLPGVNQAGQVVVDPQLNLVEAIPEWAPGFNVLVHRQEHVYMVPAGPAGVQADAMGQLT